MKDMCGVYFLIIKKELINFYIPEKRESTYKIFNDIKDKINLNSDFKNLDCNGF